MRRIMFVGASGAALLMVGTAPAFAAHCENLSKPEGAGTHTEVIVDAATDATTLQAINPGGQDQGSGGFADVWLDLDGDGSGDVQVENDVFVGRNHSSQYVGEPWVNPGAEQKAQNPNATDQQGAFLPAD